MGLLVFGWGGPPAEPSTAVSQILIIAQAHTTRTCSAGCYQRGATPSANMDWCSSRSSHEHRATCVTMLVSDSDGRIHIIDVHLVFIKCYGESSGASA